MNKKLVDIRRSVGRRKINKLLVWPIKARIYRRGYPKSAISIWTTVKGGAAGGGGGRGLDPPGGGRIVDAFITMISLSHWQLS